MAQGELAIQTGLLFKMDQNIKRGKKNPGYKTLARFIWKFQSCNPENQKMLLNVLSFLAEQMLECDRESERPK